jgi:hypothetical protein
MIIGAAAGIVLALGVFGAVAWQRLDQRRPKVDVDRLSAQASGSGLTAIKKASTDTRPVYRYSVIPGGVSTPAEFAEAMASDSVVAGHYPGIEKAKLTAGHLSAPLQAHVSYRIGDRVYWTKRKLTLQAGEQVLTDGQTLVRGRCGNKISIAPLLPTLDSEPTPDAFDLVVAPLFPNSMVRLDATPPSYFTPRDLKTAGAESGGAIGNSGVGGAFLFPPPVGFGAPGTSSDPPSENETPFGIPPGNPPIPPPGGPKDPPDPPDPPGLPPDDTPPDVPNPPTPVPEPGTLVLIGTGAALLLARRIRRG